MWSVGTCRDTANYSKCLKGNWLSLNLLMRSPIITWLPCTQFDPTLLTKACFDCPIDLKLSMIIPDTVG